MLPLLFAHHEQSLPINWVAQILGGKRLDWMKAQLALLESQAHGRRRAASQGEGPKR